MTVRVDQSSLKILVKYSEEGQVDGPLLNVDRNPNSCGLGSRRTNNLYYIGLVIVHLRTSILSAMRVLRLSHNLNKQIPSFTETRF